MRSGGDIMLMLPHRALWLHLTELGDSAVTLPCMALVVLWLATPVATRGLAWRWLMLATGVMALVAISKLAFMGWLVSLPGLDFTGLSGHSANAALVWPSLGALCGARRGPHWRVLGVVCGGLLALMLGMSRLALHVHSVSEVVLGLLVGGAGALCFLWRYRATWRLPERTWIALLSLLLVLPLVYGHRFPSQFLLTRLASQLSGHTAYVRHDLHQARRGV